MTNDKTKLAPKLRFPEFRGAPAWHPYLLEELEDLGWVELGRGEVISGQDIKAIPGDYPIYSSSVKNNGLMGTYGRFMFDEELISWSVDGGGDFFHRPRHKFSVTNVSGYMRLNTSHLNYRFLASHLQALHASLTFDYQFKAHPSVIRKLYRLAIPTTHAEQQKIADCLSSLDALIAAQARKVEALKTHKKGLMQQLFPREGESQPRLRFPEFRGAGEWDVVELGCISDVRDGTHDSPSFFQKGRPLVTSKNLRPDGTLDLDNVSLISEDDYEQINKRSKVSIGDILFGMIGTIGNPVLIKSEGFAIKNVALIKEVGQLSNAFLVQLLQSGYVAAIFAVLNTGNSQKFIALGKIRGLPLPVPSLSEQQHIADCLSNLDALITAATQELDTLKSHKKGLMQQLFPSMEAVEA